MPSSYTPPSVATPVAANLGGTGIVNNAASTLTISGNFGTTFTISGATTVTIPTTGTLLSTTTQVLTTLTTEQMRVRYDASNYLSVTVDAGGSVVFNTVGGGGETFSFTQGGNSFVFFGSNSVRAQGESNGIFCPGDGSNFVATRVRLGVDVNLDAGTGLGCAATGTATILSGGAEIGRWTSTKFSIASGKQFQLGNTATTGLIAGALAALTTASIVIYDATGTAYRVPCVTP